jgi:hypothetical protein
MRAAGLELTTFGSGGRRLTVSCSWSPRVVQWDPTSRITAHDAVTLTTRLPSRSMSVGLGPMSVCQPPATGAGVSYDA